MTHCCLFVLWISLFPDFVFVDKAKKMLYGKNLLPTLIFFVYFYRWFSLLELIDFLNEKKNFNLFFNEKHTQIFNRSSSSVVEKQYGKQKKINSFDRLLGDNTTGFHTEPNKCHRKKPIIIIIIIHIKIW